MEAELLKPLLAFRGLSDEDQEEVEEEEVELKDDDGEDDDAEDDVKAPTDDNDDDGDMME